MKNIVWVMQECQATKEQIFWLHVLLVGKNKSRQGQECLSLELSLILVRNGMGLTGL